jgi:hypothetical protein
MLALPGRPLIQPVAFQVGHMLGPADLALHVAGIHIE